MLRKAHMHSTNDSFEKVPTVKTTIFIYHHLTAVLKRRKKVGEGGGGGGGLTPNMFTPLVLSH